jgi:hypothetical protein
MLKMCLNPKVLLGLAAVAGAVLLVAPNLFIIALPVLIMAACPLSMLAMGWAMTRCHRAKGESAGGRYSCPMHPDVESDEPGFCSKCGMRLQPTGYGADVRSDSEVTR